MMIRGKVAQGAVLLFFAAIAAYGYFEGQGLFFGPTITTPTDITHTSERVVTIQGTVQHVASIRMNGKEIPITESGHFSEGYALAIGYNQITLEARDKYGHISSQTIKIMYTPSIPRNASSTPEIPGNVASSTSEE